MDPLTYTHEQLQAQSILAAQMLVEMWPTVLDGIEGMVRQTIDRGFTEREARALVIASMTGRQDQG